MEFIATHCLGGTDLLFGTLHHQDFGYYFHKSVFIFFFFLKCNYKIKMIGQWTNY